MTDGNPALETLTGIIERVTFHNPDNGFAVLKVAARGHRDLVTLLGHLPRAVAGEFIEARGRWVVDRQHGQQFKAEFIRITPPTTLEGIEKYLGSGLIKGIGPHFAAKLVEAFGEQDELVPAYAMTIHKSQGSEFPAVVVPVHTQHYTMLQRNLFYTAITRGKQLVALIGTARAIAIAVRRADAGRRYSGLRRRLTTLG